MSAGREIPDRVFAAFDLWPHLLPYWMAFDRLNAGRHWISLGMAGAFPSRIAYTELEAYARTHGFRGKHFHRFATLVDVQDEAFLEYHAEQHNRARSEGE